MDAALLWAVNKVGVLGPWKMQELKGGFSEDVTWLIVPEDAPSVVLRFVAAEQISNVSAVFRAVSQVHRIGVATHEPFFCERFSDEIAVMALSYIDGQDGAIALPKVSELSAEELGQDAGAMLRKIHNLPSEYSTVKAWAKRRILEYERVQDACFQNELSFADQDRVEAFVEERLGVLAKVSLCFQHGAFHLRNLIFDDQQLAGVIGFNAGDSGDPIEDFARLPWSTYPVSESFARGQIDGYLAGNPIERFWERYNIYVGMSLASSLVDAVNRNNSKAFSEFRYRSLEIVNTHDFTDGGPPTWY